MIMLGLVEEGMTVIKEARKRFDGERRNPWNEFECGSNYARSLSSYALLNAFSGFAFDLVQHTIGFNPVSMPNGRFRCFWSLDSGWGEVEITPDAVEVRLLGGHLDLQRLYLPFLAGRRLQSALVGGQAVAATLMNGTVQLAEVTRTEQGQALRLVLA
jgi:hypothetical protein